MEQENPPPLPEIAAAGDVSVLAAVIAFLGSLFRRDR